MQKKAVKQVVGLVGRTYEERCAELGLCTLRARREMADLIQVYKTLKCTNDENLLKGPQIREICGKMQIRTIWCVLGQGWTSENTALRSEQFMNGINYPLRSKTWRTFINSKMHSNTYTGEQWEAWRRATSASKQETADHQEGPGA